MGTPVFKRRRRAAGQDDLMRFDTKIAIAVRQDLETWRKLNVVAFLASGIAGGVEGVMGKPYEDASANRYLEMFRQPVLVYSGDADALTQLHQRALQGELSTAVYTEELFATGNDDDNRTAVRAVPADQLNLVGIAVYGPRNVVDKACKGLELHP